MLDGDVLVLEALGFVFRRGQQAVEPAGDVDLVRRAGRDRRPWAAGRAPAPTRRRSVGGLNVGLGQDGGRKPFVFLEQGGEEMLDVDLLVAVAAAMDWAARIASWSFSVKRLKSMRTSHSLSVSH